ncbi:helix-turn-helix domain-containing protein [Escherichia coli]|uniref:helix-turn-helix domain-containing protein n=1 Tax=Escherichia coli TaxID=562 RepID=UPI00388E8CC4
MQVTQLNWICLSMTDFGKRLASLRKARQLTQIELANLLDIQPRMVGRWEQGQVKPQFDYIIKLAQLLEVSIDHCCWVKRVPPLLFSILKTSG